jgi:hypothetical protein
MSETRTLAAIRSQISLAIAGLVARLEGIAKPGAIYLSEHAYRQVKQRLDLKVADFGAVQLKNIADGPRLFARSRQAGRTELAPTFAAIGTAVTAARSRKGRSRTLLPSALPAASVAVLSAVGWFVGGNTRRRPHRPRSHRHRSRAAPLDRRSARTGGPTPRALSCAVWLWDARERDALAGRTASAFTPVLIADRKRPYIAVDIPGSRSWSAGSWKRAPARRSPSRPPEWP